MFALASPLRAERPNVVLIMADDKNEGYREGIRNCVRIDGNHPKSDEKRINRNYVKSIQVLPD